MHRIEIRGWIPRNPFQNSYTGRGPVFFFFMSISTRIKSPKGGQKPSSKPRYLKMLQAGLKGQNQKSHFFCRCFVKASIMGRNRAGEGRAGQGRARRVLQQQYLVGGQCAPPPLCRGVRLAAGGGGEEGANWVLFHVPDDNRRCKIARFAAATRAG